MVSATMDAFQETATDEAGGEEPESWANPMPPFAAQLVRVSIGTEAKLAFEADFPSFETIARVYSESCRVTWHRALLGEATFAGLGAKKDPDGNPYVVFTVILPLVVWRRTLHVWCKFIGEGAAMVIDRRQMALGLLDPGDPE